MCQDAELRSCAMQHFLQGRGLDPFDGIEVSASVCGYVSFKLCTFATKLAGDTVLVTSHHYSLQ